MIIMSSKVLLLLIFNNFIDNLKLKKMQILRK